MERNMAAFCATLAAAFALAAGAGLNAKAATGGIGPNSPVKSQPNNNGSGGISPGKGQGGKKHGNTNGSGGISPGKSGKNGKKPAQSGGISPGKAKPAKKKPHPSGGIGP